MEETFTAFTGNRKFGSGKRADLASELARAGYGPGAAVLVFSDVTGGETDLDLSGGPAAVEARHAVQPRGRGRPKLGVVPREITLLPRHWEWLAGQRGGASAALRRLVEDAMHKPDPAARRDAAYRFCTAIAGDLPGFEEAMRALYAGDGLGPAIAHWPEDIRRHALMLAAET